MNKKEVIQNYLEYRKIGCKNKDTMGNYERNIRRFLDKAKNDLSNVDEKYLTKQINRFADEFSQNSLNNIKPLIKNFIKWNFSDYPTRFRSLDNLCRTKKTPASYKAEQMLKEKDIKKIIETETDLFWKVFWLVFFYGGFRGIDTIRLKWDMITFEKDGTTIIKTHIHKNDKAFYKCIPASVTPLIKKWKELNPSQWVFPSSQKDDVPINPKTPHKRLQRISEKALGKRVNPYLLRHSLATIKYNEEGSNEDIVANQLGHSKSMKETYVHLDDDELVKRAKKIWTNKKEMPVEERRELEEKIDKLTKKVDKYDKDMKQIKEILKHLNK